MGVKRFYSSESVAEGHPDKVADQIADAILDAILCLDSDARVACECLVKTDMVIVAGEISTNAKVDIEEVVRKTIREIGYTYTGAGFDWQSCAVILALSKQSTDIAKGIALNERQIGAGDQGIIYGYACRETISLMPAPIIYAHALMQRQAELRKSKKLAWLRPDAKCLVTFKYEDNLPQRVSSIVLSTQHDPEVSLPILKEAIIEVIIKPTFPKEWLQDTQYYINPAGRFVIGGPLGDCGLTGRKIMIDSYGALAPQGGGSFSGKDPSKVDRSAAYFARYIAKNLVAAELAERCQVQLVYAIGKAEPLYFMIETFGTGKFKDDVLSQLVQEKFSFTPQSMIDTLKLNRPIYQTTATYGHFGREDKNFTWEQLGAVEIFKSFVN